MTALVVNENACGVTKALIGSPVSLVEIAPNGRSCRVMLEEDHPHFKPKGSWLPACWLNGLESEVQPEPQATDPPRLLRQERIPL